MAMRMACSEPTTIAIFEARVSAAVQYNSFSTLSTNLEHYLQMKGNEAMKPECHHLNIGWSWTNYCHVQFTPEPAQSASGKTDFG